jgi:Mg2+/Co2+ transporter CorB
MTTPAQSSDRTLAEARSSLNNQRAGGRRNSIGRRSAALKREHRFRKILRIFMAVVAIWVAAIAAGLILDGIGWTGIIVSMLAIFAAVTVFGRYPRMKVPTRAALTGSDVKSLVGRTELWLESQRPALPAPAVQLVDQIGLQLDALGLQLDGLTDNAPAAVEVRKLVGEHLPELVSTYTSIPRHLRGEASGGRTPDQQLSESLGKISTEIDSVTRQLASGAIDNLAIRTRYLDYKYGAGPEGEDG